MNIAQKVLAVTGALVCAGFLHASSDWPIYKGNEYFTGNNDQIIVKNNSLKWLYQASNYVYYPVVSDGRVYFADLGKVIYCLDEERGTLLWKFDMKAVSSRFRGAAGVAGKIKYPLVKGPYLYLSDATAIYCLNKTNGIVVWARAGYQESQSNTAVIDGIYSDPIILDRTIYYGTRTVFLARETANGHVVWNRPGISAMGGFPTYHDRFLLTGSRDYKANTFSVHCLDASTGQDVWSTRLENPVAIFTPVTFGGRVYIPVNKKLLCLDLETGRRLWEREYADLVTSHPSFTDREIVLTVGNRMLAVVDPGTGAVRTEIDLGERSSPYFVTIQDQIYVANTFPKTVGGRPVNFGTVQAYRFGDRTPFWRFDAPFPGGASQPAASRGTLFLPAGNYLYAVGTYYDRNIAFGGSGNSGAVPLTNAGEPEEPTGGAPVPPQPFEPVPPADSAPGLPDKPRAPDPDLLELETAGKGDSVVVRNIFFEFNEAYLTPESIFALDDISGMLKKNPRVKLEIQGHTDNVGAREYNQKLSERRADAVMTYLIKSGVSPARLRSVGFGLEKPVASNATAEGRAQNRRTEFLILEK